MATMASLQKKMKSMQVKLIAENESRSRDKVRTTTTTTTTMTSTREFTLEQPGSPRHGSRTRPRLNMDYSGSPGRPYFTPTSARKQFDFRESSTTCANTSSDIDIKLQEIMKLSGILTIDGQRYHTEIGDLLPRGELGNGTCGHVVKMLHKQSNKMIAVKQMRRSGNVEETKRSIMDLEVVLKSHDCPYIVKCLGCFITDSDVWICMELMATCLDKLIKRFNAPLPEAILGKMAVATLKALNYLKENHGVIHRDVKPSNILLDEKGTVKLCDFGISGRLVDSKAKTRSAGCAAYMAPERIDPPDPAKPDYDIRADVWSLGITLVELATGKFPYDGCKTDFEVLAKVLADDPPLLPPGKGFSMDFCSFVKDCLTKDYKRRPKYTQLLDHRFIRRYEVANVDVAAWFATVLPQLDLMPKCK